MAKRQAAAEVTRLRLQRDRLLKACRNVLETWWDRHYPEDVFDGSSDEEGPLEVVRIRNMLRSAVAEASGEGRAIRVVIEVERGCVTAVTADTECEVTLVDYDGLSNGTVEQAKAWSPTAIVPDGIGKDAVDTALARAESAKDETLKELME